MKDYAEMYKKLESMANPMEKSMGKSYTIGYLLAMLAMSLQDLKDLNLPLYEVNLKVIENKYKELVDAEEADGVHK